jgi:hypothetical protein
MKKNLINLVIILVGAGLIIWGGMLSMTPIKETFRRLTWRKVSASVAGFEKQIEPSGSVKYLSVLDFDVDGVIHEIYSSPKSETPQIGGFEEIYYNPSNPNQAVSGGYSIFNLAVLIVPLSGLFLMILGLKNLKTSPKKQIKFEDEEQNSAAISKIQNAEVKLYGNISHVESVVLANGMNAGRAVIPARLPSGEVRNFYSDQIEGLTDGLLVSYFAQPIPISISVKNDNYEDYYIDSEEILAAIRKSFELVRTVNS